YWDARIREKVAEFGLDCFPQEFEICDHGQMLGYMAYSGMPSHYPHWSYGKSYEKLKTLYDYGVQGIPYEMVINANPSLAYLMRDNSLCLQILTIAHVYGHNDFFKNNFTFKSTRPEFTIGTFKAHADRVRRYADTPSIGLEKVETFLDAAHSLSLQCRRNLAVKKLSEEAERERLIAVATPREDPFQRIHRRQEATEPDLKRVPPTPDEDLLLFVRGHNPTPEEKENLPPGKTGRDLLFQTREVDRDPSFLRRWLHEVLMRDLDLFRYEAKGDDLVVSEVSDEEGWRKVKETLVKTVGMGSIPVIRVEDADHNHNRTLLLAHLH